MAVTIPATNWNIFDHMNSATNQDTDATIMSGTGTTPTDITIGDTDATVNQFQVSGTPPATGFGGKWAVGTNVDMSATGAHLFAWFQSLDLMDTEANNGLILRIGHDAGSNNTNYKLWTVGGSDTRRYVTNSFIRLAVDLAATADASAGTVTMNSVDGYWVGGQHTTLSGQKTTHIDNFMLMDGPILVQGGLTGARGVSSEIAADDKTDGRGVFKDIGGVYYLCAGMEFGNTAAVASYFEDENEVWVFEDQVVANDWYELSFVGHVTPVNHFQLGTKIGTGDTSVGVGGNTLIANGEPFRITATDANIAVNLYGCNFLNSLTAGGIIRFEQTNLEAISCLFSQCDEITVRNGATLVRSTITDSTASSSEGAVHLLDTDKPAAADFRDNTIQNSANYGMELDGSTVNGASWDLRNIKFSGNTTADILVNYPAQTGGDKVTINVLEGGDTPTIARTGGILAGDVVINAGVTFALTNVVSGTQLTAHARFVTALPAGVYNGTGDSVVQFTVTIGTSLPTSGNVRLWNGSYYDKYAYTGVSGTQLTGISPTLTQDYNGVVALLEDFIAPTVITTDPYSTSVEASQDFEVMLAHASGGTVYQPVKFIDNTGTGFSRRIEQIED